MRGCSRCGATLLGVFIFDEGVDPYVLTGGAVIIAAVSFITWREAQILSRAARAPLQGDPP